MLATGHSESFSMPAPTLAICIATTGRAEILGETLRDLAGLTRVADRILVCPAGPGDLPAAAIAALPFPVEIVEGERGSSHQRNAMLRACGGVDIALFLDDDFLPAPDYLAELVALFAAQPDCVVATGRLLADGAINAGYTVDQGRAILRAPYAVRRTVAPVFNAYGCNMAVRWSRLAGTGCWFDEALPLYAWAEDVDFSRQATAQGSVLKADALVGVHLAWKQGRTSGVRFGYSQVANQLYLARKGTITPAGALRKAAENIVANLAGACRTQGMIDRRGRLVGNLYGLRDILAGRSSPDRILDL